MKRRQEEKTKKELEIKVEKRKTVSSIEILKTNKRMECYLLSDMIVSGKFQPNLFYLYHYSKPHLELQFNISNSSVDA